MSSSYLFKLKQRAVSGDPLDSEFETAVYERGRGMICKGGIGII